MEFDTKIQIATEREYKVVKANEIIQKAKFDLSLLEQKTFCYAVSKIKPDDVGGTWYTFTINDYCDVCGINRNDGRTLE
ncbi:MAG: replication initiation protein, partial [Butyrivibrio sp.]|nr:replication initiation protein [Butyrivibrio sp.]